MFEANSIIREPQPTPGSRALKSQYFSQLSMTSIEKVVGNHITVIGYACMKYMREFTNRTELLTSNEIM